MLQFIPYTFTQIPTSLEDRQENLPPTTCTPVHAPTLYHFTVSREDRTSDGREGGGDRRQCAYLGI